MLGRLKDSTSEDHIREMARQGYTHIEVNGYAANFPYEKQLQTNCCIYSTPTARPWTSSSTVS